LMDAGVTPLIASAALWASLSCAADSLMSGVVSGARLMFCTEADMRGEADEMILAVMLSMYSKADRKDTPKTTFGRIDRSAAIEGIDGPCARLLDLLKYHCWEVAHAV